MEEDDARDRQTVRSVKNKLDPLHSAGVTAPQHGDAAPADHWALSALHVAHRLPAYIVFGRMRPRRYTIS
jgi:hypothetical protein